MQVGPEARPRSSSSLLEETRNARQEDSDHQVLQYKKQRQTRTQSVAAAIVGISERSAQRIEAGQGLPSQQPQLSEACEAGFTKTLPGGKVDVRIRDVPQGLGAFLAASFLLGAGTGSSENPFRALRFMMALAVSAQEKGPAHPDDVRSFQVRYKKHSQQLMFDIHDQDNNSDKMTVSDGNTSTTTYVVNGIYYFQARDGQWRRFDGTRFARQSAKPSAPAKTTTRWQRTGSFVALPDQRHNGVVIGGFRVKRSLSVDGKSSASQSAVTTCFYAKATGRPQACASGEFVMTFDHYNDPGNIVRLPKAASTAPEAFRSLRQLSYSISSDGNPLGWSKSGGSGTNTRLSSALE